MAAQLIHTLPVCKGGTCDNEARCKMEGACCYKSSAEEAREVMSAQRNDSALIDAQPVAITSLVRTFATGATRDWDTNKLDYEGFLSPTVLRRFAEYMHKNRVQRDGSVRASDNWQKGITLEAYMKSMWRHFMSVWLDHRLGTQVTEEELCALMFNVMGYLHERLKGVEK